MADSAYNYERCSALRINNLIIKTFRISFEFEILARNLIRHEHLFRQDFKNGHLNTNNVLELQFSSSIGIDFYL